MKLIYFQKLILKNLGYNRGGNQQVCDHGPLEIATNEIYNDPSKIQYNNFLFIDIKTWRAWEKERYLVHIRIYWKNSKFNDKMIILSLNYNKNFENL